MIKYAISLVLRRKLRTFLTSLGVTISVILLSFIIFGMQDLKNLFVNEFSSRFNPDEIMVSKFQLGSFFGGMMEEEENDEQVKGKIELISPAVIKEMENQENVESVDEILMINGMQVVIEGQDKVFDPLWAFGWNVSGKAKSFIGFEGEKDTLENGEAFIAKVVLDYYQLQADEVIGKTATLSPSSSSFFSSKSKNLFNKSYSYKIIGVIDTGQDRTDFVVTVDDGATILSELGGFDSSQEFLDSIGYDQLMVKVKDKDRIDEVKEYLTDKLEATVMTPEDILDFLDIIISGLTLFLVVFGLISSVVASIGIINTMVMSIYEQTREIGIIKAIGSSNLQVLIIFLIQSAIIGLLGGLMGLGVTYTGMKLADPIIVNALKDAGFTLTTFFSFDLLFAMYIALGSILIGILAGIYPALTAARLDPVKALRYE